jgi:hypothetical protein
MQTEARSWKILLREARAEVPVIVNAMTQEIFPAPTSRNCCPQRIAATALRNLLAYQIRLIVQHYSADDWNEYPEELSAFLDQVRCWLRTMKNPALFIGPRILPVTAQETEMIFHAAETFPVPSKLSLPRIRYAWAMAKRIMNTKQKNSGNLFRKLYELSCEWHNSLVLPGQQLFSISKPLEFAEKHVTRHLNRIDYHTERAISWGKELCESIAQYQSMGFCRKTAASKARKDFIRKHPYPVTDSELLMNEAVPGHSRPAIIRYQKIYLASLEKRPGSESFSSTTENI